MALGQVIVNNLNLGQGTSDEVERHLLFIGTTTRTQLHNVVTRVDALTDLSTIVIDDALGDNIKAAQANGKQNWTAAIIGLADDDDWDAAIDLANATDSFEGVVLVDITTDKNDFVLMQAKAEELKAQFGRFVFFLAAVAGINPATQTWAQYETAMINLQDTISANVVVPVPMLHGTNIGALAGRLCDRSVTVADTPMRVATGSVLGLGEAPVDSAGMPLALSTLNTLANNRFSVPQWYPDFDGIYWGDASTLEAAGGDYQVLEYVRIVHKASRRVRIKAIRRIGDRQLNSTALSIEQNKQYFSYDLRQMAKSIQVGSFQFPGEITAPRDSDISIHWTTKTHVIIGLVIRPHNSPKQISINIALDLSNLGA